MSTVLASSRSPARLCLLNRRACLALGASHIQGHCSSPRHRHRTSVWASNDDKLEAKEARSGDEQSGNGANHPAAAAAAGAAASLPTAGAAAAALNGGPPKRAGQDIDREIFDIALPTLATLAADPIASLVSTAWVGRLGSPELAAVGVALSVYNTLTKLFNMPLLSVTTSAVASALGENQGRPGPRVGDAVSAAVMLALVTGLVEAALLGLLGVAGLGLWGAGPASPLHTNAAHYLTVRALSAPATVLFLCLTGVFRGLGDTRAPFYASLLANIANILLEPLLIFTCGWGVAGAAGAIAIAQGLSCIVLLYLLNKRVKLQLAGGRALQDTLHFLRPTGLLTVRTLAISGTFAVATALVARTGATHTAAHQVAFQVWLASSLLADSLAVAAQALLARTLAAGDKHTAKVVVGRTVQLVLGLGLALMVLLALGSPFWPRLFTQDAATLRVIGLLIPAVVLTQPANALAFLFDGVLYGAGGFQFAAVGMVAAVLPALGIMLLGSRCGLAWGWGLDGQLLVVWAGLAALMVARFVTIYVPYSRWVGPFEKLAE